MTPGSPHNTSDNALLSEGEQALHGELKSEKVPTGFLQSLQYLNPYVAGKGKIRGKNLRLEN